MFSLPQSMQIYFCVVPIDMRRSFDTLAEVVRSSLGHEPRSGHLFVFRNKAEDCLKVLYWDKDGYAIWYKRLEKGKFTMVRLLFSMDTKDICKQTPLQGTTASLLVEK